MEKNKNKFWFVNISEYHHRTMGLLTVLIIWFYVFQQTRIVIKKKNGFWKSVLYQNFLKDLKDLPKSPFLGGLAATARGVGAPTSSGPNGLDGFPSGFTELITYFFFYSGRPQRPTRKSISGWASRCRPRGRRPNFRWTQRPWWISWWPSRSLSFITSHGPARFWPSPFHRSKITLFCRRCSRRL